MRWRKLAGPAYRNGESNGAINSNVVSVMANVNGVCGYSFNIMMLAIQ